VFAEGTDLGIEFRIEPVGVLHRSLEVVGNQDPRDATEVTEGILQTADELVRRLAEDRLAVRLARMTQDDSENPRLTATVGIEHWRATPEVDLGFLAGSAFHAPEGKLVAATQSAHEPLDTVVAGFELAIAGEVLVDPLGS
jgi:hypothetical protein